MFGKKKEEKKTCKVKTSDMHQRRKFTFNHSETAIIDTALENMEEMFKKDKDEKYANKVKKVRDSLVKQEQEHWNKENNYSKGYSCKRKK